MKAMEDRVTFGDSSAREVPVTMLPQYGMLDDPACLDGSPTGLYFVPSRSNSTKWTISLEGGGWCVDEATCIHRLESRSGSSKYFDKVRDCGCMNIDDDGYIIDNDCNCILMPYCDGSSFSGYRAKPWKTALEDLEGRPYNTTFTSRGLRNLDASIEWALDHGMSNASEFVLAGGSAGGLATFLHADRVIDRVRKASPNVKAWATPFSGYFLDHDNFQQTHFFIDKDYDKGANIMDSGDLIGTGHHDIMTDGNFSEWMRSVYHMHNLTFDNGGALNRDCRDKFPTEPHLCFLAPHMVEFIRAPLFIFNSKFDEWQILMMLKASKGSDDDRMSRRFAVHEYGTDFLEQLEPVRKHPKNGMVITSCLCHQFTCPWAGIDLMMGDKRPYAHYVNWATNRTYGDTARHVDMRGYNGDGLMQSRIPSAESNRSACLPFRCSLYDMDDWSTLGC
jgi:hypothetical protein